MQNSFDCVIHRLGEVCYECTSAVAMGFFDGVHWGHRAIFQKLISVAEEKKLQSIALTFDIHPSELLAPKHSPGYISTFDQSNALISSSERGLSAFPLESFFI